MPNLIGKSTEQAKALIQQAGLLIKDENIVKESSYKPEGEVIAQFPYDSGALVSKNAQISITVSSGLPSDALVYTFDLLISPAKAGKASEIRIVYTDATGKDLRAAKRSIRDTTNFPIKVILAPNTEALVSVYRDGQLVDTFSRTYEDARNGADNGPTTIPGNDPVTPPPDLGVSAPPQGDSGSPFTNGNNGSGYDNGNGNGN